MLVFEEATYAETPLEPARLMSSDVRSGPWVQPSCSTEFLGRPSPQISMASREAMLAGCKRISLSSVYQGHVFDLGI
jgi:hypothetical protein